jgi:hypothetical protein
MRVSDRKGGGSDARPTGVVDCLLSDVAVLTAAYRRSIGNRLQQTVSALNTEPEQGSNGSEGQSGVDTAGGSVDT